MDTWDGVHGRVVATGLWRPIHRLVRVLTTPGPRKGSHRQSITSLPWQTMLKSVTTRLIGKESRYQPKIDWIKRGIREAICIRKAGSHTISHDEGHPHLPNVYSKFCSLPPHLVVALRSTDMWSDIDINLLVHISFQSLSRMNFCNLYIHNWTNKPIQEDLEWYSSLIESTEWAQRSVSHIGEDLNDYCLFIWQNPFPSTVFRICLNKK